MFGIPATSLDTDTANKLADESPVPEFFKLLITPEVIEIPRVLVDSIRRAGGQTAPAAPAAKGHGVIRIKGHVRQYRYEAETRSEFRIHEKIISSDPT